MPSKEFGREIFAELVGVSHDIDVIARQHVEHHVIPDLEHVLAGEAAARPPPDVEHSRLGKGIHGGDEALRHPGRRVAGNAFLAELRQGCLGLPAAGGGEAEARLIVDRHGAAEDLHDKPLSWTQRGDSQMLQPDLADAGDLLVATSSTAASVSSG